MGEGGLKHPRQLDRRGWHEWIEHSDNAGVMRRREDAGDGAPKSSGERRSMNVDCSDLFTNRSERQQFLSRPRRVGEFFGDLD